MRLYAGFDLHSTSTYLGIVDEEGKRVFKKKLPNDREIILCTLSPYKDTVAGIVAESTYNWYWLVDILTEAGYKVHLANTTKIQKYSGLKYADDQLFRLSRRSSSSIVMDCKSDFLSAIHSPNRKT